MTDKYSLASDLILIRLRDRVARGDVPMALGPVGLLANVYQTIGRWMRHQNDPEALPDLAADALAAFVLANEATLEKEAANVELEVDDLSELDTFEEDALVGSSWSPPADDLVGEGIVCPMCGKPGHVPEGYAIEPKVCSVCADNVDGAAFREWVTKTWLPHERESLSEAIVAAQDDPHTTGTTMDALQARQDALLRIEANWQEVVRAE